jgi:hypothetical protein
MNILHSRRRIGLALMLAGALALPVATPADAAPQSRPGHYLDKGDNHGKGKKKQAQQANRQQGKGHGKVKARQQQANRAENRARRQQHQANQARQNARQAERHARQQNQQARRANQNARQAQVRAAQERAQAQAARQHQANARAARQQAQAHAYQAQRRQGGRGQVWAPNRSGHQRRHPHYIQARPRPQGRAATFAVDGYLEDDGYQCVQLRDDQGNPYILEGRVEGLFAGDHVRLVAREAPFSSCGGYGRPVLVTRVVRVWADAHHRSAYYQANIDGSFAEYTRWRRGDDWLRDARGYDPYNDGYEDDYYYEDEYYDDGY